MRRHRPAHSRTRSAVAAVLVGALALSGAVVLTPTQPAAAAYPDSFHPFSASGGFTVYAREDATLGNTETEGSIAVGGVATKPGAGQYTLVHVVAGTGDYTLPVVDGDPTRLLVGSYDPASDGITAITSAGTSDPSLRGDLKLVERDGPLRASARADWLRLNPDPSRPDQTPIIDATHQRYPDDAAPPTTAAGGGSIYTADTSGDAVAGYVEANREASYEQAAQCFADIADPSLGAGSPVTIAEDVGDRIVLAPLSPDRPNVVDYADIAGASLIQFSPGPEPGVTNPLIIRVAAGTTEVLGARADPQGAHSPYMLWDLSAVTGEVSVRALQARIDGSIYAPDADVTVEAAPLDGQLIGRNVTLLGGEVHSFLFASEITCAADDGTFRIRKDVEGVDPASLGDATFTVNYTATTPGGDTIRGTFELPASGAWVPADGQFPTGTQVTFEEIPPASIPGYDWETPTVAPDPLTITANATADVVVTNTATARVGTFSVAKTVTADPPPAPPLPDADVPVSWTATFARATIGSGVLQVPLDGTPVEPGIDFPLGTLITLDEDLSAVTPPPGYRWTGAHWDPGQTIRIREEGTRTIELTNVLSPDAQTRTVSIVKQVPEEGADPRFGYAVSYNVDPPGTRRTREIAVGDAVTLLDIETGADILQLAEPVPTFDGAPVDVANWDPPVFRVTADGVTQDYPAAGFEGQVPLEQAVVSIPLPASGDISVQVVNDLRVGTFALVKQFTGTGEVPDADLFTVSWTATTPTGEETSGTIRLPADGTEVTPRDDAGDPIEFPFGTVVTFDEQPPPTRQAVVWGDATFDPDPLVIGAGGATETLVTLTNEVAATTGTFVVAKDLAGIDASELDQDSFLTGYVAFPPGGGFEYGSIVLPADGTPAGPVDAAGDPVRFPLGTRIVLAEAPPADDVLPDRYEWARPVWSPSRTLVISSSSVVPTVTVTNTAVEYVGVSLTKTVSGDGGSLPPDARFTIDWWLDGEEQPPLSVAAGETVSSDRFPVGSIIEATEPQAPAVTGATWGEPVWTLDGEVLPVQANGRVVVPVASSSAENIAFILENRLQDAPTPSPTPVPQQPLPATGGVLHPVLPIAGLLLVLIGSALLARRRRA
jgi:choice-of-anchor A domain-containing protein/LPXTG-motif cell wall-anchored protein